MGWDVNMVEHKGAAFISKSIPESLDGTAPHMTVTQNIS